MNKKPTIDYGGDEYELSKDYSSYDDYVDDPNNLHPSEHSRAANAVTDAEVPSHFNTVNDVIKGLRRIKFPGCSSGVLAPKQKKHIGKYLCKTIGIPKQNKKRVLIYEERDDGFHLIDDFLANSEPMLMQYEVTGKSIKFFSVDGLVLTRER